MMRVAYLLPPLHKPSGWRSHAYGFIQAIRPFVQPILLVEQRDAATAAELFPFTQPVVLPAIQDLFLRRRNLRQLVATRRAISRCTLPGVDLVHSLEAYPTGMVGHWLAQKLKRPHILTAHGTYGILPHRSWRDRIMYSSVLRRAAALAPVSPETAALICHYFPRATKDLAIHPVLNGNNYYQHIPQKQAMQRVPPQTPTLLSVGAVKPRKGYLFSLQAFARLSELLPAARYRIVGNVDNRAYYEELRRYTRQMDLTNVEFMGRISDQKLRQCYQEASLFLLTPQQDNLRFEGFGLVYLEAGAFGLPVVGTRTGGVPSAIRHGETGFVVEPGDVDALVQTLLNLLTDAALAQRMGRANRQWAESLTWEYNAQQHLNLYQQIAPAASTPEPTLHTGVLYE